MKNLTSEQMDPEYFRLFFTLSMDMFCIAGADGYFKHINQAWASTLGYSLEELKSQPYLNFVHPDDLQNTNATAKVSTSDDILGFENRYRCKDGTYKHFRWASCKHPTEDLVFAVARDITEQKEREADLYKDKVQAEHRIEHIHTLLSQVPALAAVVRGPEHVFEFANQDYCALIGNRNPVGMTVREAIPGFDDSIVEILGQVYRTGAKFSAKDLAAQGDWHADGNVSTKYFNFVYSPLRDSDGQVNAIWCLAYDVTEFKNMENRLKVSEKMASLGTLAAGVAHEVNNPLAYVMMALELIAREIESLETPSATTKEKTLKKIKSCEEGLERIRQIVNSLKSFARNDEGEMGPVNVSECIQSTIKFVNHEIKHRARLELKLNDSLVILGNEGKLSQVFLNLIVNAVHAMETEKFAENCIVIESKFIDEDKVEISVTDTGCGIPPQSLGRIFEPFFTTKPIGEGTGLGLSICHGIISSMKGTISVQSEVGVRTTFQMVFPRFQTNTEVVNQNGRQLWALYKAA